MGTGSSRVGVSQIREDRGAGKDAAVAASEGAARLQQLVDEQAAVRRVATLVAAAPGPKRCSRRLRRGSRGCFASPVRPWDGLTPTAWSRSSARGVPAPSPSRSAGAGRPRGTTSPGSSAPLVRQRGSTIMRRPPGRWASTRDAGYRSAVATPITVEGQLWGVMTAASNAPEPLPPDTEARLASFTDLVATAARQEKAVSPTRGVTGWWG